MKYNQTYLSREDLEAKLCKHVDSIKLNKVISAYEMVDSIYADKKLVDGTPIFFHSSRVCKILIDEAQVYDIEVLCAALLHNIYKVTANISLGIIDLNFGPYVAFLLETLMLEYSVEDFKIGNFGLQKDINHNDFLLIWLSNHLDTFRAMDYGINTSNLTYINDVHSKANLLLNKYDDAKIHKLISALKEERNKLIG